MYRLCMPNLDLSVEDLFLEKPYNRGIPFYKAGTVNHPNILPKEPVFLLR